MPKGERGNDKENEGLQANTLLRNEFLASSFLLHQLMALMSSLFLGHQ
jgi:hypothetical protein